MKKYICLLVFAFCFTGLQAGDEIAKLREKLTRAGHDTERVELMIKLAGFYESENMDSAIAVADRALALSQRTGYEKGICMSNLQIGILYQNTGQYNKANTYFFRALKYAEKLNIDIYRLRIYNSIANAYAYQKMFDQALMFYEKALAIPAVTGKKGVILMNMGNIAYNKGYEKKDFGKAFAYFDSSLKIAEANHDSDLLSSAYGNYSLLLTDAGKYEEALKKIEKAMQISAAVGAEEDFVFLHYNAGRSYAHMKNYPKALYHLNESMNYCRKFNNRDYLSECYLCLAEINNATKNYKEAFDYIQKYKALEDSLLNEETTNQLNELRTIYETDKKEKEIELSHQKLQNYEAKQSKLIILIFSSIGGAVLLLVLVLVIFSRYRLKQRANEKLESAYAIIEEKQKDITDSINYAQKIQYAILPEQQDIKNAFTDSFIFFQPRDVVSGDFYWFHELRGNNSAVHTNSKSIQDIRNSDGKLVLIAAADCTGHGVPGALMSMIGSSLLDQIVLEGKVKTTGDVLDQLRAGIKAAFKQKQGENRRRDGMDITLLAISGDKRTMQFSGANNGAYMLRNGEIIELAPDKQPVGQHEGEERPFSTKEIELLPGDCFYLYTDGFADQFGGEKGKKFKYSRLKELLLTIHKKPMQEQYNEIQEAFVSWKGNLEQIDDVCIIGIKI